MGLFSKGAQTRIDETVRFITNGEPLAAIPPLPAVEHTHIRSYLNDRMTNYHGGHIKAFSDTMSMNDLALRGTEPERKMRRAIIMIETVAMSGIPNIVVNAKALPNPLARFNVVRDILRELVDQDRGNYGLLLQRLNEFKAHPAQFMRDNFMMVFGSNQSGLMTQYFGVEINSGVRRYKFFQNNVGRTRAQPVNVINVPAVLWSAVPGRTATANAGSFAGVVGTQLAGSDIMVTTQFSGCAFCYKNHLGQVYAAHIWPSDVGVEGSGMPAANGHGGATRLARQLAGQEAGVTAGDFAAPAPAGGTFQVYGMGYSRIGGVAAGGYPIGAPPTNWMTLIGVNKVGAGWRFYSQHVVNSANNNVERIS
jgi:hypothetical protein